MLPSPCELIFDGPEGRRTLTVKSAAFQAVRHAGGIAAPMAVCFERTIAQEELPAIVPYLTLLINVSLLPLETGSNWMNDPSDRQATKIPTAMMIFWDWDRHAIEVERITVVSVTGDLYRLRILGQLPSVSTQNAATPFSLDANFEFHGYSDYDADQQPLAETERGWNRYLQQEIQMQLGGGPITRHEWLHTDRFRRLCRALFPQIAVEPAPQPPTGVIGRVRQWLRRATPTSAPPETPKLPVPSVRLSKLLLAALLQEFASTENIFNWNISGDQMAQMLENYADGCPTDEQTQRVANYLEVCMYGGGLVNLPPSEITANQIPTSFRLLELSESMGDLFIWRLVPERSRRGCCILRDLFGDPFRPTIFDPAWRTSTVVGLANSAYLGRDFASLPILADALQDAGCEDETILSHCRADRKHVKGCWVLDAILEKR